MEGFYVLYGPVTTHKTVSWWFSCQFEFLTSCLRTTGLIALAARLTLSSCGYKKRSHGLMVASKPPPQWISVHQISQWSSLVAVGLLTYVWLASPSIIGYWLEQQFNISNETFSL